MIPIEEAMRKIANSRSFRLIDKFELEYVRHNNTMIYFEKPQNMRHNYPRAGDKNSWYRAMSENDFYHLSKYDAVEIGSSYRGITATEQYAKGYLSNESPLTHLVEFRLYKIDLNTEFTTDVRSKNLDVNDRPQTAKAEKGALSFGLGPTGHYGGKAGHYFNNLLSTRGVTWSLIGLNIKIPG